ncbi:MAG TPA: tripartite tricarboxylate transporter substrate binding protein [Acetobacteraceae bacterium]|nr:tripartite tricarboxylate transporter substrate binding protein [Acetobacteraceae bacterium]
MQLHRRTLLGSLLAAPAAQAQDGFPNRPIRIVVPYPPGAINDMLARWVGDKFPEALGQPGVVENRAGAAGNIGTAHVARSTPDGYTIGIGNTPILAVNPFVYSNMGYDPLRDLSLIAVAARLMNVLVVNPDSGLTSLQQIIERARAAPGRLTFASSGSGSSPHLAAELLKHMTGVDITHVPFRGGAASGTELIAGRVDMLIDNVPNAIGHIRGGQLRALAVTGTRRDPALPDVPTFAEAGVPGFEMYLWFGFIGPAGIPGPILERLSGAIRRIVTETEVAERIRRQGAEVWPQDPGGMRAALEADQAKWAPVVRAVGLRVE